MIIAVSSVPLLQWNKDIFLFVITCLPPEVFFLSLQECDEGYTRSSSGLYLGTCERCNCNGHASSCDPETGSCLVGLMLLFPSLHSLPVSNLL